MVCHALVVCLWGLRVPFVDFTELLTGTACFCGHGSHVMVQPFPVEVLALSLILSVPFSGVWRLAKIYFCSVAGMIIRWAFVTTPFSVAI